MLAATATANVGSVSSNWSGYVATSADSAETLSFSDVTGTWRVPRVRCTRAGTSAAFWVGIGGSSTESPALEQLGSSADCSPKRVATYRLWTEIVPAPAHFLAMKVRPGDSVSAAVLVQGQTVTMSIQNLTRGTRYTTRVVAKQQLDTSSAEWIAEAPSLCRTATACDVIPLSNFGTVGFTSIAATANGHTGVLTDPLWLVTPIALASSKGVAAYSAVSNAAGAVPNAIAPSGRSFTVSFRQTFNANVPSSPLSGAPLPSFVH